MCAPKRRHFVATGLAASAMSFTGADVRAMSTEESRILPRFTDSAVVSKFAWTIFTTTKPDMPPALSEEILGVMPEIVGQLRKFDARGTLSAADRRRAKFFARVSTSVIAPYTLRRAGYEGLARACEVETFSGADKEDCAAEHAGRTIGFENLMRTKPMTAIRNSAKEACRNAANAHLSFLSGESRCLLGIAQSCAGALYYVRENDEVRRIDKTADKWVWNTAVAVIRQAISIS